MLENCNSVLTQLQANEKLFKDNGQEEADQRIYRSMIGRLLYLNATRLDIMFVASYLSRFMQSPSHLPLGVIKRFLRYAKGTLGYGVQFEAMTTNPRVVGFMDNNCAGSLDDMKSTSCYTFTLANRVFLGHLRRKVL